MFRVTNPLAFSVVAALIIGAAFGAWMPRESLQLAWIADVFLRLIRAVIAPLLFGVLVKAMSDAGGIGGLGRIGWRAIVYFEVTTTVALLLGWAAVAFVQAPSAPPPEGVTQATSLSSLIIEAFPASIFDAMARGDVLQIIIFCLLFGAAVSAAGEKAEPVLRFAEAVAAVSFEFTRIVMWMAPLAIFAAIASTVARSPRESIVSMGAFIAAAWIAQILFMVVVIGGSVLLSGRALQNFAREVQEPFVVAFATTSSAAAMPKTIDAMERLGVRREIYGIVTPLSLTLNMTGSCIHLAMCAFYAARTAGIALTPAQQVMLFLVLKLSSKGVAGIPRANFVILTAVFASFGLPAGMLTTLLGIDALIDPVRTSTNVLGHSVASPVIERWVTSKPARS